MAALKSVDGDSLPLLPLDLHKPWRLIFCSFSSAEIHIWDSKANTSPEYFKHFIALQLLRPASLFSIPLDISGC